MGNIEKFNNHSQSQWFKADFSSEALASDMINRNTIESDLIELLYKRY